MKRIELLRKQVFENLNFSEEFHYLFYKSYAQHAGLPEEERYAEAFYFAFSMLAPSINEGELIVGKRDIPLSADKQQEWEEIYKPIAKGRSQQAGYGQASHMAVDYELLLSEGILGIIKKLTDIYLTAAKKKKHITNAVSDACRQ
jgi:hypothetical protein